MGAGKRDELQRTEAAMNHGRVLTRTILLLIGVVLILSACVAEPVGYGYGYDGYAYGGGFGWDGGWGHGFAHGHGGFGGHGGFAGHGGGGHGGGGGGHR
jgi:hypothetical protein